MVSNMNIVVFTYFKKGNLKPLAFVFFSYSLAEHWAQGTYDKILCQQLGKFEWFFLVFRFTTSASTHGINILFCLPTITQPINSLHDNCPNLSMTLQEIKFPWGSTQPTCAHFKLSLAPTWTWTNPNDRKKVSRKLYQRQKQQ